MQQSLSRNELSVVTPEQVLLRYKTAGPGSRAGAHAIDMLILCLFYLLVLVIIAESVFRTSGWMFDGISNYLMAGMIIAVLVIQFSYFVVCECMMGRTVGGKIVGLRVIRDNGQPVTVLSSVIRNLMRVIDMLPTFYVVGIIASFLHPRGKRLGDMLAGTVVIYDRESRTNEARQLAKKAMYLEGWNLTSFTLEEHHKRIITREEWLMLESIVERRNELTLEKEEELGKRMARYFMNRLELSAEIATRVTHMAFLLTLYEQLRADWEI
jgi:uncharacterized RDD family membrane protein YckC